MPTKEYYEQESRMIDANHTYQTRMRLELELVRILLAEANGKYVGMNDKIKKNEILDRYPEFVGLYDIAWVNPFIV